MRTEYKEYYVAMDDTEFDDYDECFEYESKMLAQGVELFDQDFRKVKNDVFECAFYLHVVDVEMAMDYFNLLYEESGLCVPKCATLNHWYEYVEKGNDWGWEDLTEKLEHYKDVIESLNIEL